MYKLKYKISKNLSPERLTKNWLTRNWVLCGHWSPSLQNSYEFQIFSLCMKFNIFENSELQNFLWLKVFKPNVLTLIAASILDILWIFTNHFLQSSEKVPQFGSTCFFFHYLTFNLHVCIYYYMIRSALIKFWISKIKTLNHLICNSFKWKFPRYSGKFPVKTSKISDLSTLWALWRVCAHLG